MGPLHLLCRTVPECQPLATPPATLLPGLWALQVQHPAMNAALLPARAACAAAAVAGPSGRRAPQPFTAAPRYQRRQVAVRGYKVDLELLTGEVQQLEVGDGETILEAIMDKVRTFFPPLTPHSLPARCCEPVSIL